MAGFVQIIEFDTSHIDEVQMLGEKFADERRAEGLAVEVKAVITADRDRPNHYLNIVQFPSHEVAMQNSDRTSTTEFAARLAELCDGAPVFHNLDVINTMDS